MLPCAAASSYCLELCPLDPQTSRQYIEHALKSASIHDNPFQPEALELLIRAGGGLPRTINHLAQRAMEAAAAAKSLVISAADVQSAIDRIPWLVNLLHQERTG
jgi:type II secretory pathway predicted ATPase ExeA